MKQTVRVYGPAMPMGGRVTKVQGATTRKAADSGVRRKVRAAVPPELLGGRARASAATAKKLLEVFGALLAIAKDLRQPDAERAKARAALEAAAEGDDPIAEKAREMLKELDANDRVTERMGLKSSRRAATIVRSRAGVEFRPMTPADARAYLRARQS